MAREGTSVVKDETAPAPDDPRKPDSPTEITKPGWTYTATSAWAEFNRDQCTDLAAALTYYSVLSIFPGLLALVSLLGVFGQGEATVAEILSVLRDVGQGDAATELEGPITSMVTAGGAGFALVAGIGGAVWSASAYVGAFGRAMNRVYQVDEGRPIWKLRPQQLLITLLLVVLAGLVLLGLVLSGGVARSVGGLFGLGEFAVTLWGWLKLPVILVIVMAIVAILYHATPNVKQPRFRWVSVGAAVGILIWVVASLLFGFYVSNFAKYNATYGSLAGVIVFLLWLWLTNLALLFGAEVDAELERARQLQAGIKAEQTLQLPPKDTRESEKAAEKLQERVEAGRHLREAATGSQDEESYAGERASLEPLPSDRARLDGWDRRAP